MTAASVVSEMRGRAGGCARALLFACALSTPFALATPGHAQSAKQNWYTQRVTLGGAGLGIEYLWSEGASLRSQVVVNGHPIITLVSGTQYVVVDALLGAGLRVKRHPNALAQDRTRARPFGVELKDLRAQGGEHVGEEDFSGVVCQLYRVTDTRGRQEVCVREGEDELPVFLRRWDRETNNSATIQYLNWRNDFETSANFFTPDARFALTDYSYEEYVSALQAQKVSFPIFYPRLLHGAREPDASR